jgi:hypothetical protein
MQSACQKLDAPNENPYSLCQGLLPKMARLMPAIPLSWLKVPNPNTRTNRNARRSILRKATKNGALRRPRPKKEPGRPSTNSRVAGRKAAEAARHPRRPKKPLARNRACVPPPLAKLVPGKCFCEVIAVRHPALTKAGNKAEGSIRRVVPSVGGGRTRLY